MNNLVVIVFSLFIVIASNFHILVEDSATNRKGTILGKVKIIHHQRDNKPAMIIMGPNLVHQDGQSALTLQQLDIIHLIQEGLYRFEPESMQLEFENNTHYLQLLKYKSKKNSNWIYRFYFQTYLHQLMKEIRDFIDLHQIEPHVDLFQQLPNELKQQLLNEHQQSIKAFHKASINDQL